MHASRLATALLAALLAAGFTAAQPATARAGSEGADPAGAELMRLTNLDRMALGLSPLAADPVLVSIARNRPFACPSDPTLVIDGRSQDMAERSYFAHEIPGCRNGAGGPLSSMDVLVDLFGYNTFRAENLGWNTYANDQIAYLPACDLAGTNCRGTATTAVGRVAGVQRDFMRSPGHRATIVGDYDRFGCGTASAANGRTYFTCLFSKGGPNAITTADPSRDGRTSGVTTRSAGDDRIAPRLARLSGVARSLRAGRPLRATATVTDDQGLHTLSLTLDGVRVGGWSVHRATAATRTVTVPASRLSRGRHVFRWSVTDAAGNSRWTSWVAVVP